MLTYTFMYISMHLLQAKIGIYSSSDDYRTAMAETMDITLLPQSIGGSTILKYNSPHSLDPTQETSD